MNNKLIVALAISALLAGCNSSGTVSNKGTVPIVTTAVQATTEVAQETTKAVEDGLLGGKFKVELGSARKVESNEEDIELLEVTYTFTNNSDEAISAFQALMFTAYQDGIEIFETIDYNITGGNDTRDIKPGASLECKTLFKLISNSEVEVEVVESPGVSGGESEGKVVKVYTLE